MSPGGVISCKGTCKTIVGDRNEGKTASARAPARGLSPQTAATRLQNRVLPRTSYPLLTIGDPQKRAYNRHHVAPHGLFCQNDSRQRFACRVNFADKYIKS